jgi:hypothetical protein
VFSNEGTDGVQAADSGFGSVAVLQDHDDRVVIMAFVLRIRPERFLVLDGPHAPQRMVARVLERPPVGRMRGHPRGKLVDLDGAKVNRVTDGG